MALFRPKNRGFYPEKQAKDYNIGVKPNRKPIIRQTERDDYDAGYSSKIALLSEVTLLLTASSRTR